MLEQVKRAIELVKKSLEIINQRLDNLKTMIRCNTERIDLLRQHSIKWTEANQRIRQLERTVQLLDKVNKDTIRREYKNVLKHYLDEYYKKYPNQANPFDEDNIPSNPDDGSWVGR